MGVNPYSSKSQTGYKVDDISDKTQNAQFEYLFTQETELTGYMKLKLWVEAQGSDDMDLFVAVEKIDPAGYIVQFPYFGNHGDGGVALGSNQPIDTAMLPLAAAEIAILQLQANWLYQEDALKTINQMRKNARVIAARAIADLKKQS